MATGANILSVCSTIDGQLSLVAGGLSVAAGGRLVQKGQLSVSVTSYMGVGVRVAAGATWMQEGRTIVAAGSDTSTETRHHFSLLGSSPNALPFSNRLLVRPLTHTDWVEHTL